jgi:hypothetical protein
MHILLQKNEHLTLEEAIRLILEYHSETTSSETRMRTNSDNAESSEPLVLEARGRVDGIDYMGDSDALSLFISIERDYQNQVLFLKQTQGIFLLIASIFS